MNKKELRQEIKSRLGKISEQEKTLRSEQACRRVIGLKQFKEASCVMVFLTFDNEIDTVEIILHAWQEGKVVAVPRVFWDDKHIIPIEIHSLEKDIVKDAIGVPNPVKGTPVPFGEIDLVITPGIGFDRNGNRIGRGAGYYDRFFSHDQIKAYKCGLAFSEQIVDSVPVTDNDVAIDMIVTDKETIICDESKEN